jgi:hypothetical protein
MRPAALAFAAAACAIPVEGARPLVTDDARLLESAACQLESWIQWNRGSREDWIQPGCNPLGAFELAIGYARTRAGGEARTTDVLLQGKTVLREVAPNGWGIGLVAGAVRHPADGGSHDAYAFVPLTFSFRDDQLSVSVNAGGIREGRPRRSAATWGLASDVSLDARAGLVAEIFGRDRGRPFVQAGFRYAIVPERVVIDATCGSGGDSGNAQRWFSLGIRVISPRLIR